MTGVLEQSIQRDTSADLRLSQNIASLLATGVRPSNLAVAFSLDVEEVVKIGMLSSIEAAKKPPPDELTCPISMELFVDPVVATDGFTYDRAAIEQHYLQSNVSPKTNLSLANLGETTAAKSLLPTQTVKILVMDWLEDRALVAKHALSTLIDAGDEEAAIDLLNVCEAWCCRFPSKLRLAYLKVALRVPMHGDNFKKRESAFMNLALELGLDNGTMFLEHHRLSMGYCRYGYYGAFNAARSDEWRILPDSPIITTLLPACCSVSTFTFEFKFENPNQNDVQTHGLTSEDFFIGGVGKCFVRVFCEKDESQKVLRARLEIKKSLPKAELWPVLISMRRKGHAVFFFWRECGRHRNDGAYDVRMLELVQGIEDKILLELELVVRSLDGIATQVPMAQPREYDEDEEGKEPLPLPSGA